MDIIEAIANATKAAQSTEDQKGRESAALFGAATNNADPVNQRRIKATTEAKGGLSEMDWAMRCLPTPFWDPPLPHPGMSLALDCFSGDTHDAQYAGVMVNRVNPPFEKADPVNDDWRLIPGIQTLQVVGDRNTEIGGDESRAIEGGLTTTVGKDDSLTVKGDLTAAIDGDRSETTKGDGSERTDKTLVIEGGQSVTIKNDAGASLTLSTAGFIVLSDAFGHSITLSGGIGGTGVAWNLGGDSLNLVNVGDVTIDGRSVAVVGARDDEGDALVNRGY